MKAPQSPICSRSFRLLDAGRRSGGNHLRRRTPTLSVGAGARSLRSDGGQLSANRADRISGGRRQSGCAAHSGRRSQHRGVAVAAAQRSLQLSINRYTGGVTTYLEVTTAQAAALTDERTQVEIQGRRMTDTVLLIKALGGGWDAAQLPDTGFHRSRQRDGSTIMLSLALLARNAEPAHLVNQCCAWNAQTRGSATVSTQHPLRFSERRNDVFALYVFQCSCSGSLRSRGPILPGGGSRHLQLRKRSQQFFPGRKNDGTLDEVLQFPDSPANRIASAPLGLRPERAGSSVISSEYLSTKRRTRSGISSDLEAVATRSEKHSGDKTDPHEIDCLRSCDRDYDASRQSGAHPRGSRVCSQALELLLLQHAQELRLQFQRYVANFVEEKSALVGKFETTDLLRDRSCECALLVSEQFALQQAERDRGAIQLDEDVIAPVASWIALAMSSLPEPVSP